MAQIFYMMVGLPGSGKTTKAKELSKALPFAEKVVVHSSDAIRAELLGDANDQTQQDLVFKTLHQRIFDDLRGGNSVVYDATNIHYKHRRAFLHSLRGLHIPDLRTVCVFMATPIEACLRYNENRNRVVPNDVISQMYRKFDVPMYAEGWDKIEVCNAPTFVSGCIDDKLRFLSQIAHDNPHHTLTIGQHCMAAWSYMREHYPNTDDVLLRAMLLHDFGKERTKSFVDSKGNPCKTAHYYNHERVGAYESFRYTGDLSDDEATGVALLIRWHMAPFVVKKSNHPPKTEAKFKGLLGEQTWERIMVMNNCDRNAH